MLRPSITLNRRVYQRLKGESTGDDGGKVKGLRL
jgi:hypothetical protein